jgi:hypothetical protein
MCAVACTSLLEGCLYTAALLLLPPHAAATVLAVNCCPDSAALILLPCLGSPLLLVHLLHARCCLSESQSW